MPIVFVHGVNNRDGEEYRDSEALRNGFLRELVAPALGLAADDVYLTSPYWGANGATFAWGMAALPDPAAEVEKFGGGSGAEAEAFGRVEMVLSASPLAEGGSVVENAKRDFSGVVDLLYASALAAATSEDQSRDLARSYLLASAYAEKHPAPAWLATAAETNFVDQLDFHADASREESFGKGGVLDSLKEGLSRIANLVPDAASSVASRLARRQLNSNVTRFAGDVFTYLARRGSKEAPGVIVKIVLDALRDGASRKNSRDSKLIVIAHSFGGEIVHDILSHYDAALEVDCLITVGSQVGLFEELKLYLSSQDKVPPDPPTGKVPRPTGIKRWLNVFDLNDVLSYRVEPIFLGTSDFQYDTGYSTLSAHGGYFLRPSFYRRLAARLKSE